MVLSSANTGEGEKKKLLVGLFQRAFSCFLHPLSHAHQEHVAWQGAAEGEDHRCLLGVGFTLGDKHNRPLLIFKDTG